MRTHSSGEVWKTYLVPLTQEQIAWLREEVKDEMDGAGADRDEVTYGFLEAILEALAEAKERDPFVVELRLGNLEAKVAKLDRQVYRLYQQRDGKADEEPQAA
jgi:hypothetical protein